jgi:hypothetical protein
MHPPTTATVALALALIAPSPPAARVTASRVPVRIVHASGHGGIDWGDAAIGAAAGAGITLLGLGGALAVSQRHTNPTASPLPPGAEPGQPPRVSQPTHTQRKVQ